MTVMAAWSARSSTFDFGDALPNSRSGPVEARTAPRIQITCNRFSQKKVLAKIFGELGEASPYSAKILCKSRIRWSLYAWTESKQFRASRVTSGMARTMRS